MRAAHFVAAVTLSLFGGACQAIIGADFSGYAPLPTECDPLAPSAATPVSLACKATERCSRAADGSYTCGTNGTHGAGDACAADKDCDRALSCVFGFCFAPCDSGAPDCPAGQTCAFTGKTAAGHSLGGCVTACDLAKPDACAADERCTVAGGAAICAKATTPSAVAYDTCATDLDCPARHGCVEIGHMPDTAKTPVRICLAWATAPSTCTAPEEFVTPIGAPTMSGLTYGNCFAPCDVMHPTSPDAGFRQCAGGARCSLVMGSMDTLSVAVCSKLPDSPGGRDSRCASDEDCDPGLACRAFTTWGHCVDYCDYTQADCPAGRFCTAFKNARTVTTTSGEVSYSFCAPPASPCEPVTSTPCLASERCDLDDADYTVCNSQGSGLPGDRCTDNSACVRGTECVGGAAGYYCSPYCRVGTKDCGSAKCNPFAPAITIDAQEYGYCNPPNCDPFQPQGASPPRRNCPNGVECHFIDPSFMACRSGGTVGQGGACNFSVDCGAGLFCIFNNANQGSCKVPCRVASGDADCVAAGKSTCKKLDSPFTIDGVEYGICS